MIAFLALATACGGSNAERQAGGTTTAETTTASTTTEAEPFEGGRSPVHAKGDPAETALLEAIDVGKHEGYDRVVFRFQNVVPGYRVAYVKRPLVEDGSGAHITVAGDAVVGVRLEPASGFDLSDEGHLVYTGPKRIEGADSGAAVVEELVRTGDFEAVLNWAVGLESATDFRVLRLEGPPRLVVDFKS